jgi:hypothetical protein
MNISGTVILLALCFPPMPPYRLCSILRYHARDQNSLLINVLTLDTNCTSLALILASSRGAPNPGSAAVLVQPIRARKRSSLRIAMAFMSRIVTVDL